MLIEYMLFNERSSLEEFLALFASELAFILDRDMGFSDFAQFSVMHI